MSEAASALGELAERGAQSLTARMEESSFGRGVLNLAGNKEWELDLTEGGRAIKAMNDDYIKYHDQALQAETQKLAAVRKWHQGDDTARNALPVKTTKMVQYYAHAVATQHPIQVVTKSILDADPENASLTQAELMVKNQKLARLAALEQSYGREFENAAPIIGRMLQDKDPRVVANAHRIADIISNEVRDTTSVTTFQGTKGEQSAAKVAMNKAFQAANKIYKKLEMPQIPLLNSSPTYFKQSEGERTAHRILNQMLIPFVAIPHIGQLFHIPASSPLPAIGSALMHMSDEDMHQTVEASAITANTLWQAMYRDILGETGKVAEWTNSPTVGKILARTVHQPGFTWLRRAQLNMAATVGFHSAIYWAHNLAESGSKIAAARLSEMGINPAEVLKQGGKLSEDQLQRGVYHFTNNRMFFSRSIDNSLYQNRDVILRSMYMYHSFVSSESAYLRRELLLMLKAGDIKGIAQFAGTLGIVFTGVAAPLLSGLEVMARTFSVQQGAQETEQRFKRMYQPSSFTDFASNYLAMLSHIGAAGVYFNYINAMRANRLASAVLGPMVGAVTTDVTDAYHAVFMPDKAGKHDVAPLERDLLKQTIPVLGSPLSHHLVPPRKTGTGTGRGFRLRSLSRGRRRF